MKWAKIEERPNYSVSDSGLVRNDKTGRILKQSSHRCGYKVVMLGRKTVPLYVHRLVAKAFIPNPEKKPQVDHVNGNKADNRAENLRWVTASENSFGAGYRERCEHRKKRVEATNGEETIVFDSRRAAADYFECSPANIAYGKTYAKGAKRGWIFRRL